MIAVIMVMAGVSAQLVPRIGARPLLIAGSAIASGGMFGLSRISGTAPTRAACSAR